MNKSRHNFLPGKLFTKDNIATQQHINTINSRRPRSVGVYWILCISAWSIFVNGTVSGRQLFFFLQVNLFLFLAIGQHGLAHMYSIVFCSGCYGSWF